MLFRPFELIDSYFFSHCAQKKKFSLNTFETSTGKLGNFEVNNRSSEILRNPWQSKDFVEESLTSLLRNLRCGMSAEMSL